MKKVNEREIAVCILLEVLDSKAYNNIALRKTLDKNNAMSGISKAFVTELVNGVIRNLIYIDYVINLHSKTQVIKMRQVIQNIIRTGVYQLLFMDRIPESAAVNEAVKLAKVKGFVNLSGFVNGVLRSVAKNKDNVPLPDENDRLTDYLSIRYSYPGWITARWVKEMSGPELKAMFDANSKPPVVTACVNSLKIDTDSLAELLVSADVDASMGRLNKKALYLSRTSDINKLDSFKKGFFHIMSESAMSAVDALDLKPGHVMIDLCAAPGGKSFYAAQLMENTGRIISRDIHEHKLGMIINGASRLGINIISTEHADASVFDSQKEETADRLLLDVPCSGLGLVRKKPDIKYTKSESDIHTLSLLQRDILAASYRYLKIGGIMVYSTCTLTYEENMGNILWFTQNFNYSLEDCISLIPNEIISDGFFIAKMRRNS